jgi:hypothetical protein
MTWDECSSKAAGSIPSIGQSAPYAVFVLTHDENGSALCGVANETMTQCIPGTCMDDGGCDDSCLDECVLGGDMAAGNLSLFDAAGQVIPWYDNAAYVYSYFTLTDISASNLVGERSLPVLSGAANFSDLVVSGVYGRGSFQMLFSDNSAVNKTVTTRGFSADPYALTILSNAIPPTAVGTTLPNVTIEFRGADGGSIQEVEPLGKANFQR